MKFKDDYDKFRRMPLEKGKMSIRKFRRGIKKSRGIFGVGDVLEKFLCQFSKLELRWIDTEIRCNLDEKYDVGVLK